MFRCSLVPRQNTFDLYVFKVWMWFNVTSHHVLHVWGCGVNAASQLVVQLQNLFAVRPENGSPGPVPSSAARTVLVSLLQVATQQLPQLLGVRQEEGKCVRDADQEEDEEQPDWSRAGHSDTFGCLSFSFRLSRPLRVQQTWREYIFNYYWVMVIKENIPRHIKLLSGMLPGTQY